jgi:polysaccharide export outer membrane protein
MRPVGSRGDKSRRTVGARIGASIMLMALLLGGCAGIPRAGPSQKDILKSGTDVAGFTLIDMDAHAVGYYRAASLGHSAGTGGTTTAAHVILGPGDILNVTIAESKEGGLFAPLATGGTPFPKVRVDQRGTISLPYAGRVKVAGLEPAQAEGRIRARLSSVAFEPQVYVELLADPGSSVLVTGLVRTPGRFSTLDGPMTIIDAINRAGGTDKPPHQVDVVIRRGKRVIRMPLQKVYNGRNRQLQRGDEVVVEANLKVFNALGAVTTKGQLEFSKPNPTLLDALSQVGGLDNLVSHNSGVFVFRLHEPHAWKDDHGHWHEDQAIFRFDMSKPEMFFIAGVFGMKSNDTIYVTNAPSIEWERAIRPIAITVSTVAAGVSSAASLNNNLSPGN